MKPLLRFFTEEGRTRSRNALRRYIGGAIAASAFGCVVAVALYLCWVPRTLTPLQRAVYETDLLGLTLRDSIKLVTARMGFFVGQHRYLEERVKIAAYIDAKAANGKLA